jgi:hypothetical protein
MGNKVWDMPKVNVCDCGSKQTVWIECDGCDGYDYLSHIFLGCANCSRTSEPFTEKGEK